MDGFNFPESEMIELEANGAIDTTAATCPALDLEIAIFFDGTGNNLSNVEEGNLIRANGGDAIETSFNNALSNVAKLFKSYQESPDQVYNACGGIGKLRYSEIVDGIGTTSGQDDSSIGFALGWGQTGVEARAQYGFLRFLRKMSEAKSRGTIEAIKLDVFGFSRGSAAARHFVNCVRRGNAGHGYGGPLYEIQEEDKSKIEIRFLGIFDTVVSWGLTANDAEHGNLLIELPNDIATKIVHITALDEHRENFPLTEAPRSAETIRMPGAHSDIGGGYPDFFEDRVEIKQSLQLFSNFDRRPFNEPEVLSYPRLSPEDEFLRQQLIADGWITHDDTNALTCEYWPLGTGSYDPYIYRWYLTRPWLNHRMSHVALHVMHHKAIEAGVPLPALPNDDNHALSDGALSSLAQALIDGAQITESASIVFRRNYVHHSASWARSGPFYPMAPHQGGARRTVYNNDGSLQKT